MSRQMFEYRVTKYDPAKRDRTGAYIGEDWTSVSDVGRVFNGEVLTREAYETVEDAYATAALAFLAEAGIDNVEVRGLENPGASQSCPPDGAFLDHQGLHDALRAVLREEFWCRFETERTFIHVGWDYYLYVGVPRKCDTAIEMAQELGLFVEPFASPYRD